ncbi:MAG: hypothetical protein M3198_13325 [Actinomycetota bacterium]|nr:hypothetical protein [Actinomycetota bacterium]
MEWRVKKERSALILELTRIEAQAILAEAVVMVGRRRDEALERAAVETFREQLRCGLQALRAREAALGDAQRLSEDSREIAVGLIDRLTANYTDRLEQRSGRLS